MKAVCTRRVNMSHQQTTGSYHLKPHQPKCPYQAQCPSAASLALSPLHMPPIVLGVYLTNQSVVPSDYHRLANRPIPSTIYRQSLVPCLCRRYICAGCGRCKDSLLTNHSVVPSETAPLKTNPRAKSLPLSLAPVSPLHMRLLWRW